jgi:hypothetical protein
MAKLGNIPSVPNDKEFLSLNEIDMLNADVRE